MTTATEVDIGSLVWRKAGVNGGRPCLAGTGFSVHQLSVHYNEGLTPAEILQEYPHLDLARVHAGIAYYLANRTWLDAEVQAAHDEYWSEVARRKQAAARQTR